MKNKGNSPFIVCLVCLWIFAFMSGCSVATGSSKHVTSTVDYLFPDGNSVIEPGIPIFKLPLCVGIAFVPGEGGGNYGRGLPRFKANGFSPASYGVFVLTEQKKIALLQEVADHFKTYAFIKEIEIIPSAELTPRGSFDELARIRTTHGLDVIALLSYDQVQFTDEGTLSLTYWTVVGAYIIPGEKNDTHTMLDVVVYDIKSRKMLFRAPGTSHIKGSATPANLSEQLRGDSDKGFGEAAKEMIVNLDGQLAHFKEKVKENPTEYKVIK